MNAAVVAVTFKTAGTTSLMCTYHYNRLQGSIAPTYSARPLV